MKVTGSFLITLFLLAGNLPVLAQSNVVASIKPLHSLVAQVMMGTGAPNLLVDGSNSPHTYNFKPSNARDLEQTKVIFWIGDNLETFLKKPIETLGGDALTVELIHAPNINQLAIREGGAFEEDDHDHADSHDTHEHEDHLPLDPHIWLDPENAKAIILEVQKALSQVYPENAQQYEANTKVAISKLDKLLAEISNTLTPVKKRPFVVFHDAYQHFENRFGLNVAGSIIVNPDTIPGAARITEIRQKIRDLQGACVFAEPQFQPQLVTVAAEGSSAKTGILDPIGFDIDAGSEHYFTLIRTMAKSMLDCLTANNQ